MQLERDGHGVLDTHLLATTHGRFPAGQCFDNAHGLVLQQSFGLLTYGVLVCLRVFAELLMEIMSDLVADIDGIGISRLIPARVKTADGFVAFRSCKICNLRGVTRYSSKLIAKLQNEYLPDARKDGYKIQTVCCSYDTDVFEVRNPLMVNWDTLRKTVKRMGINDFIQLGIRSSIEDWILCDIEGICRYLKLKSIPKSLKGNDGIG